MIRGAQGLCFAVSSATARVVASRILRFGRVRRGALGIAGEIIQLRRRLVLHHALGHDGGVRVAGCQLTARPPVPGFGRAMIVALDDRPVAGIDDLYRLLSADRIGMPCRVDVLREGRRLSIEVVPRERAGKARQHEVSGRLAGERQPTPCRTGFD